MLSVHRRKETETWETLVRERSRKERREISKAGKNHK